MRIKKNDLRNHVVYNNDEIVMMRKYLKDIAMVSNKGGYPQYEIGKIASILNLGGETAENFMESVE